MEYYFAIFQPTRLIYWVDMNLQKHLFLSFEIRQFIIRNSTEFSLLFYANSTKNPVEFVEISMDWQDSDWNKAIFWYIVRCIIAIPYITFYLIDSTIFLLITASYTGSSDNEDISPREKSRRNQAGGNDFCVRNIGQHSFGRREIDIAEQGIPKFVNISSFNI